MRYLSLFVLMGLMAAASAAELLKAGDTVPSFAAKDQHGVEFQFKPGVRYLLIAFDMSTGKDANKVFEKKGAAFLDSAKAVYVSNIHGMPGIGRAFALPKMRKYPHRIILADEDKLLDPFPKEKDRITVLSLDEKAKVTGIKFWDPEKQAIDEVLK